MEKSDQELVARYMAGSESAFGELVQRHSRSVYTLVYNITRSAAETEDISAETFVKVWKNLKKYKKEQAFKPWLLTIARNTALDYLRKKKHVLFSDFENAAGQNYFVDSLTDDEPSAFEEIIAKENREKILAALEKLSPSQREILQLRYGEDLTFEEIAEVLDKPMNTVKSQGRRALLALKALIAPK